MLRALRIAATSILAVSCSSATEPVGTASATVTRVTIAPQVDGSIGRVDVMLSVIVHNATSEPIYLPGCSAWLERRTARGEWEYVWSPLCTLVAPADPFAGPPDVPPGHSVERMVQVWAYADEDEWPAMGIDGTYRLIIRALVKEQVSRRVSPDGVMPRARSIVTNEFSLSPD